MPFMDPENVLKHPRSERLEARISREQKALFQRAAALQGRSLTDFLIASAYEAAVKTVREHDMIRLGEHDRQRFVTALLNPPEPGQALREAAEYHKKHVES